MATLDLPSDIETQELPLLPSEAVGIPASWLVVAAGPAVPAAPADGFDLVVPLGEITGLCADVFRKVRRRLRPDPHPCEIVVDLRISTAVPPLASVVPGNSDAPCSVGVVAYEMADEVQEQRAEFADWKLLNQCRAGVEVPRSIDRDRVALIADSYGHGEQSRRQVRLLGSSPESSARNLVVKLGVGHGTT